MSESYMHRFAKQTLAGWVRGRIRIGENFKGLQPLTKIISIGTEAPMFGVYEEFPVTKEGIGLSVNRETYPDAKHGWETVGSRFKLKHNIPLKKELDALQIKPKYFFDIGIVNPEGRLYCVLEVCHKHSIRDDKIQWLKDHNIEWVEFSAEWILNQCHSPFSIQDGILRQSSSSL